MELDALRGGEPGRRDPLRFSRPTSLGVVEDDLQSFLSVFPEGYTLVVDEGASPNTTVARKKTPRKLPVGWAQGSVQDVLGLTDAETALVEMRVRLAERVRERRSARRITQRDLARRMGSTQPRVARLEQADASLEFLIRALLALGVDRKEIGRLLAA